MLVPRWPLASRALRAVRLARPPGEAAWDQHGLFACGWLPRDRPATPVAKLGEAAEGNPTRLRSVSSAWLVCAALRLDSTSTTCSTRTSSTKGASPVPLPWPLIGFRPVVL